VLKEAKSVEESIVNFRMKPCESANMPVCRAKVLRNSHAVLTLMGDRGK
jgi:hypothetical protein